MVKARRGLLIEWFHEKQCEISLRVPLAVGLTLQGQDIEMV